MALDKMVDSTQLDSDLTSVADAIRAKSGGSGQLAFPSGFVSEIGNIPSGGGGDYVASDWLDPSKPTGDIVFPGTSISAYAMYGRTGITGITADSATSVGGSAFYGCTSLNKNIYLPKATSIGDSCFQNSKITRLVAPKASLGKSIAYGVTTIVAADVNSNIGDYDFYGATAFGILVIRKSSVASLVNTRIFANSKFASGKAGGVLYVPNDLISSYQSASNWSTILGYATNQIKSIESTHTDPNAPIDLTLYYIDGTPIPTT